MITKPYLLYIDDEEEFLAHFQEALSDQYNVITLNNPFELQEVIKKYDFRAMLIDLRMPQFDGFSIIKHIKQQKELEHIPLFLFSSDNDHYSRINGLKSGIADYLFKLLHIDEIKLRIQKGIEVHQAVRAKLVLGNLVLNQSNFTVQINGQDIPLTLTEFKILIRLLHPPESGVTAKDLVEFVFQNKNSQESAVRVHIANLKKKLESWDHDIYNKSGLYLLIAYD
jgi:DNA-binding response OmpR family regulator